MYGLVFASLGSVPTASGRNSKEGFHTCRPLDSWGGPRRQLLAWRYGQHGVVYHGVPRVDHRYGTGQRFKTEAVGDERTVVAEQDVYKPPLFKPFISKVMSHMSDCILVCLTRYYARKPCKQNPSNRMCPPCNLTQQKVSIISDWSLYQALYKGLE